MRLVSDRKSMSWVWKESREGRRMNKNCFRKRVALGGVTIYIRVTLGLCT